MQRLARILRLQGRHPDALTWLNRGLALAPTNKNLRLALIEHLTTQRAHAEAARQYEELDRLQPNNPDTLSAWGQMLLRDNKRSEDERRKAAAIVWGRYVQARPK